MSEGNMNLKREEDDMPHPILDAAELAAEELRTLRERLSCDTRHSFRTPLTVIDGTARRLERNAASMSPDEIRVRVHTIRETVEKMVQIVERSIEMSELASCVQVNSHSAIALKDVVQKLTSEYKQTNPAVGFIVSCQDCDNLITSDQRLVELLLDKLLSIGVDIARECGRIEFVTWSDGAFANLSLKAILDSRSPKSIDELSETLDETQERLTLLCKGMEVKLIRLIVEQNGGELEIVTEPNLVEFDLSLPISVDAEGRKTGLITAQASTN